MSTSPLGNGRVPTGAELPPEPPPEPPPAAFPPPPGVLPAAPLAPAVLLVPAMDGEPPDAPEGSEEHAKLVQPSIIARSAEQEWTRGWGCIELDSDRVDAGLFMLASLAPMATGVQVALYADRAESAADHARALFRGVT